MYVRINKVNCTTNYNVQGTDSQKITCLSIYNGGTNIGTYSIPAHIAWLNTGTSLWQVYGGINENGINATKNFYPFWLPDTMYINYKQADSFTYTPRMRYRSDINFWLLNDFETGNSFGRYNGDTVMTVTNKKTAGEVFQGSYSGKIQFGSGSSYYTAQSPAKAFPLQGQAIFVEMNYKCDIPFQVGIMYVDNSTGDTTLDYPVTINPKTTWNKIYVNISVDVQSAQATWYKVIINATKPTGNTSGYVLLDDIKVLNLN